MKYGLVKAKGTESLAQRILIYGPPKAGKTEALGHLAAEDLFEKVIWLDLERGYMSLFKLDLPSLDNKLEIVDIKDTGTDPCGVWSVMEALEGPVKLCEKHGKLKAKCTKCAKDKDAEYIDLDLPEEPPSTLVVIETFSQLSASALNHVTLLSKTNLADMDSEEKATFNHYGHQGRILERILTGIQQSNCSIAVSSHEMNVKLDDKKELLSAVAGTSNFAKKFPKAFDHVIRIYPQNGKHVAVSDAGHSKFNTGSRLNSAVYEDGKIKLINCWKAGPEKQATPAKAPVKAKSRPLAFKK